MLISKIKNDNLTSVNGAPKNVWALNKTFKGLLEKFAEKLGFEAITICVCTCY
jgi:hypothetical protein